MFEKCPLSPDEGICPSSASDKDGKKYCGAIRGEGDNRIWKMSKCPKSKEEKKEKKNVCRGTSLKLKIKDYEDVR